MNFSGLRIFRRLPWPQCLPRSEATRPSLGGKGMATKSRTATTTVPQRTGATFVPNVCLSSFSGARTPPSLADTRVLSPTERSTAFGELFFRAIERRRSRSTNGNPKKQKRN